MTSIAIPNRPIPPSFHKLVVYFALFMVIDFIASTIAFTLERQQPGGKRDFLLLGHVWLQRFAYRQLFSLVLVQDPEARHGRRRLRLGQAGAHRHREAADRGGSRAEGTMKEALA